MPVTLMDISVYRYQNHEEDAMATDITVCIASFACASLVGCVATQPSGHAVAQIRRDERLQCPREQKNPKKLPTVLI